MKRAVVFSVSKDSVESHKEPDSIDLSDRRKWYYRQGFRKCEGVEKRGSNAGDEVILVDTGLPAETPVEVPDENAMAFLGKEISSYMDAFAAPGYKPEDQIIRGAALF